MSNKAFAVYHTKFEVLVIYSAATRSKAIYAAYTAAREAGYEKVLWTHFLAKRAPEYDDLADMPDRYPIGHHARNYDLSGNFTGYDQFGCLKGLRIHPRRAYTNINREATP